MAAKADLYERELANFREDIRKNPAAAVEHYGFALLHSLAPDERVQVLRAIGKEPDLAEDFYNMGVGAARAGDWADAAAHFRKAVEKKPAFAEAHYNLALSYEKAGMHGQAATAWNGYADVLPAGQEKTDAKKHAQELGR